MLCSSALGTPAGQYRFPLEPGMLSSAAEDADFSGLVDEQRQIGDPPSGKPGSGWKVPAGTEFPLTVVVDFGKKVPVASLWLFDSNNNGEIRIETGAPDAWEEFASYGCDAYQVWKSFPVGRETRYLRLTIMEGGAVFTEIAVDAYSEEGWQAVAAEREEKERIANERKLAMEKAREEALKRPLVEMAPYGKLSLVDEVDLGAEDPGHMFTPDGGNVPEITEILGRKCRVLPKTEGESTHFTVRMGKGKLLRPGAAYVLVVEYPEDAPRSMTVLNTGNESSTGFHTGLALGDALHPKYVDNRSESLDTPLSGKWEHWSLLFRLHDRFPEKGMVRGSDRARNLTPEDGFDVSIAQFSAKNIPVSNGAAVASIRLYEVLDEEKLALPLNMPPASLPHRSIFWREEMSDGVFGGKDPQDRGIDSPIEWYRHKAELMRFLGINTFAKDLLEFGAVQHWDSTEYGGNKWAYFNWENKDLWGEIVGLMGGYGFDILPYYEYAGSKGSEGLGNQRRAKPLTRDDAYTHIKWIESSNADITDPDTIADFKKMLDLTIVKFKDKAVFRGAWLRPRSQLPVGFGKATLDRFSKEANGDKPVSRDDIRKDKALYARYIQWWDGKRREFLVAVRDYLREKGVEDAIVLFTGDASEPGPGFGSWDSPFVTDSPKAWEPVLARKEHLNDKGGKRTIATPADIVKQGLYKKGLTTPGLTWGGWEGQHANPADDPENYHDTPGVLLSHAFNRSYTVTSPETMDLFRSPAGLALLRHYTLNENMMFDKADQPKLGYFVANFERAGAFCMQAEALAMANGDPTMLGYLSPANFGRGFPEYVRDFNANFLALPALPSKRLEGVCENPDITVREIQTPSNGTYLSIVNTGGTAHDGVEIRIPAASGSIVTALATGEKIEETNGVLKLDLRPCQLVSVHIGAK